MLNGRVKDQRSNELVARVHTHDQRINTLSLGCATCLHYGTCGGLAVEASLMDCLEQCCGKPSQCTATCPTAPARFVDQVREVRGFELGNVPRAPQVQASVRSDVAPLIYHGSRRGSPLQASVLALRLRDLIDYKHRTVRDASRAALCERFGVDSASTIVVSGVDKDSFVERWWSLGEDRRSILDGFATLGISVVTVPNFSVLLDRPRMDDMHAMKRIAICFAELQEAGIAGALHPNGRTPRDFERWSAFVAERPEVETLAYEFITGPRLKDRKPFHIASLTRIAREAGRPLNIIVRGDPDVVPLLRPHFRNVLYLDTMSFMKTQKRFSAVRSSNSGLTWEAAPTPVGAPLDRVLQHNVDERAAFLRMAYFDGIAYRSAA